MKRFRMNSIRSKVFFGVLSVLLCFTLAAEFVLYRQAVSFAENELFEKLRKYAVALSQVVYVDDHDLFNLHHDWESKLKLGSFDQAEYFEFKTMDNEFLTDSHNLGGDSLPEIGSHDGKKLVDFGNIVLGVYQYHFKLNTDSGTGHPYKLIVAENTNHIRSARLSTLKKLALFTPLALLAAFVISYGLSTIALSSLARFRDRVQSYQRGDNRAELDLNTVDKEMLPLGQAINQHIRQINQQSILESKLLAETAHELRTPLVNMRKEIDHIRTDNPTGGELAVVVDNLDRDLSKLQGMTDNMLLLYRIESGNYQPRLELFDLEKEIARIVRELKKSDREKIELSGSSTNVYSNRSVLRVILTQLISNASSYAPESSIGISWEAQQKNVHLYVDDAGPGIPESEIEMIFSRNYRFENRDVNTQDDGGLGLTLVRLYANSVNASVTCSESPQGGARFTSVLPAAETDAAEKDVKTSQTKGSKRS